MTQSDHRTGADLEVALRGVVQGTYFRQPVARLLDSLRGTCCAPCPLRVVPRNYFEYGDYDGEYDDYDDEYDDYGDGEHVHDERGLGPGRSRPPPPPLLPPACREWTRRCRSGSRRDVKFAKEANVERVVTVGPDNTVLIATLFGFVGVLSLVVVFLGVWICTLRRRETEAKKWPYRGVRYSPRNRSANLNNRSTTNNSMRPLHESSRLDQVREEEEGDEVFRDVTDEELAA